MADFDPDPSGFLILADDYTHTDTQSRPATEQEAEPGLAGLVSSPLENETVLRDGAARLLRTNGKCLRCIEKPFVLRSSDRGVSKHERFFNGPPRPDQVHADRGPAR